MRRLNVLDVTSLGRRKSTPTDRNSSKNDVLIHKMGRHIVNCCLVLSSGTQMSDTEVRRSKRRKS
jgi:hypothetical protein